MALPTSIRLRTTNRARRKTCNEGTCRAAMVPSRVWCVFDVDEHPRLDDALKLAKESGFEVALSNPCIELWALLHFMERSERIHRHEAQSSLREFLPKYDKKLDFRRMHGGYTKAVERAQALQVTADAVGDSKRNPSTGVYRLTERIRLGG